MASFSARIDSHRRGDSSGKGSAAPGRPVRFPTRHGNTNPLVIILLALILVALIALVIVVAMNGGGSGGSSPPDNGKPSVAVQDGQVVRSKDVPNPPKPPKKAVNDSKRIKETLQAGKTYEVTVKAGFTTRAEDKDWGIQQVTNLTYVAEMRFTRRIVSNDGRRIVELRQVHESRNVKVLCDVEAVKVELGLPGDLILQAIDYLSPGTAEGVEVMKPIAEGLARKFAQGIADNASAKAFAHVDNLAGKTVRITYIDGIGVDSLVPEGCTLSAKERDFLMATATLSDCYLFPDLNVEPGKSWTVDGRQLITMLDPSLQGVPEGDVVIGRTQDETENGRRYAGLRIEKGFVRINDSTQATHRMGTFSPRGSLRYALDDQHVTQADLKGDITVEKVSKDHILFEASFRTQPKMTVNYFCRIVP